MKSEPQESKGTAWYWREIPSPMKSRSFWREAELDAKDCTYVITSYFRMTNGILRKGSVRLFRDDKIQQSDTLSVAELVAKVEALCAKKEQG
jgi:hypothetical protein